MYNNIYIRYVDLYRVHTYELTIIDTYGYRYVQSNSTDTDKQSDITSYGFRGCMPDLECSKLVAHLLRSPTDSKLIINPLVTYP